MLEIYEREQSSGGYQNKENIFYHTERETRCSDGFARAMYLNLT